MCGATGVREHWCVVVSEFVVYFLYYLWDASHCFTLFTCFSIWVRWGDMRLLHLPVAVFECSVKADNIWCIACNYVGNSQALCKKDTCAHCDDRETEVRLCCSICCSYKSAMFGFKVCRLHLCRLHSFLHLQVSLSILVSFLNLTIFSS